MPQLNTTYLTNIAGQNVVSGYHMLEDIKYNVLTDVFYAPVVSSTYTGPQGPKGDTGAQGAAGPAGPAGTVRVGTVTTVDGDATVYNSGTSTDAVLDFGIPKGPKGDVGPSFMAD
jgi:hypothetical protein